MNCFFLFKASSLPMSIIIVGVGPAEFDGKISDVKWVSVWCLGGWDIITVQKASRPRSKEKPALSINPWDQSDDSWRVISISCAQRALKFPLAYQFLNKPHTFPFICEDCDPVTLERSQFYFLHFPLLLFSSVHS